MTEGANQLGDGLLAAKASASSAAYQHQKLTHTERGNSWGLCAPIPAVVHDNTQDWPSYAVPARAGFLRDVFPTSLLNWRGLRSASFSRFQIGGILPRRNSRVRAVTGCASHFHSAIGSGSRPAVGNTAAHHQPVNAFGDVPHVLALSSSAAFAGSNNASTRGQGRGRFTQHLDHHNQELGTSIQAGGRHD